MSSVTIYIRPRGRSWKHAKVSSADISGSSRTVRNVIIDGAACTVCMFPDGRLFAVLSHYPLPNNESVSWSAADEVQALAAGWGVFDSGNDGGVRIERYDDSGIFESDEDALRHVRLQAACGFQLCQKALAFVEQERWK